MYLAPAQPALRPCLTTDYFGESTMQLFCRCTASVEQAANRSEVLLWSTIISSPNKNILIWVCVRMPGNRLINFALWWCAVGLLLGAAVQMTQLLLLLRPASTHLMDRSLAGECSSVSLLYSQLLYDVDRHLQSGPKKVSCTFVITTLVKHTRFYNFCSYVSRKKRFTHSWKICPPHLNNVLTLPCES